MQPARIEGYNVTFGVDQGYAPLYAKVEIVPWHERGTDYLINQMTIAFKPSPEELQALVDGQCVILTLNCSNPPPMRVETGTAT